MLNIKKIAERKEEIYGQKQAVNYIKHRVSTQPQLEMGKRVYVKDQKSEETGFEKHHNPRSYILKTDSGTTIRRRKNQPLHVHRRLLTLQNCVKKQT